MSNHSNNSEKFSKRQALVYEAVGARNHIIPTAVNALVQIETAYNATDSARVQTSVSLSPVATTLERPTVVDSPQSPSEQVEVNSLTESVSAVSESTGLLNDETTSEQAARLANIAAANRQVNDVHDGLVRTD
jgi:hypothetical protein